MRGTLPLKAICTGRAYDEEDIPYADHLIIEGVIAAPDVAPRHLNSMWTFIAKQVYGINATSKLVPEDRTTYRVEAVLDDDCFTLAYIGQANDIARKLLDIDDDSCTVWIFTIDVDSLVMHDLGLKDRSELYSTRVSFLTRFEDDIPAFGNTFESKIVDTLRAHGFCEFSGARLYREDAYQKMNMIMESWDLNNRGFFLKNPLATSYVYQPYAPQRLKMRWKRTSRRERPRPRYSRWATISFQTRMVATPGKGIAFHRRLWRWDGQGKVPPGNRFVPDRPWGEEPLLHTRGYSHPLRSVGLLDPDGRKDAVSGWQLRNHQPESA